MNYSTKLFIAVLISSLFAFTSSLPAEARGVLQPRTEQNTQTTDGSVAGDYTTSEIKSMVQQEFGDDHPMVAVARCESSFRQFDNDGDALRNPKSDAIGIFQILEGLHEAPAEELGIDIFTAEGNIEYARKLYDSFGLAPWSPSSLCWDDGSIEATDINDIEVRESQSTRVPVQVRSDGELESLYGGGDTDEKEGRQSVESVDNPLITEKLVSGVRDPQVQDLQRLLNDIGYQLSASGPGSAGQETDFFGAKTRAAVKEFQCEQDIVCDGGRYTTGFGLVDKKTRQALNQAAADREDGVYRIGSVRVRTDDVEEQESVEASSQSQDTLVDSGTADQDLANELARAQALVDQLTAQINNQ
jgi:peptidoglycan hydrolase-like protein with peptidoglycan-binding domain